MAFETGTADDLGDLISKLDIFMVANGWTQDDFDDGATTAAEGFAIWTKNTMNIGLKWVANAPNNMSIHQATAYSGSGFPGAQTDDSGNGFNDSFGTDAQLDNERCVNDIGDGPFLSYHFFEQDASPAYVHVVVEISSGTYRHFGWGEMEKFNDWTGGEYCYGHFQEEGTSSTPVDAGNWPLFPGYQAATSTATTRRAPTIRAEDLPHQLGASEMWLHHGAGITSQASQANWVDTAGENKQISLGGFQAGPDAFGLGQFEADISTGHIPMYPLTIWTFDFPNNFVYYLGDIADIRGISIFNFSAAQEVTIGSDTWVLFPASRRTVDLVLNRTFFVGIAYKKVTA